MSGKPMDVKHCCGNAPTPPVSAAQDRKEEFEFRARQWALANARKNGNDRRTCGHTSMIDANNQLTCVECAVELGRRQGVVEAGAYLTHKEAMDEVRAALPDPQHGDMR